MSNKDTIKEISEGHKEPAWALSWRNQRLAEAENLPKSIKHGIGISALFPEIEPDYGGVAEYHVDASRGLEIYTWKEAMTQEEIEPILKGLLESEFFPTAKDFFRASAHALFRSGLVIYVQPNMADDGTFITEKLTLDTLAPDTSSADILVVIVKEGAKFDFTSNISGGSEGSVHSRTLVVLTESDAVVCVTQADKVVPGAMVTHSSRAIVAGNGKASWCEVQVGDMLVSSVTDTLLIGSGASAGVRQGIVAMGSAIIDVDVSATHLAEGTHSHIATAGVGRDTSRILYRGLVDMQGGVKKVEGMQEARFLALSGKAKIDAIPSLDIASNDVRCAHKLSISHVREGDTFYPKLRGLSDEESRALFLEGHFAHVFGGDEYIDIMKSITETFTPLSGASGTTLP